MDISTGLVGGPSGLPMALPLSVKSTAGFEVIALLPEVSRRPPMIHFLKTSSSLSGRRDLFGGIVGSSTCIIARQSLLLSGLPETTAAPEPPPFIMPL